MNSSVYEFTFSSSSAVVDEPTRSNNFHWRLVVRPKLSERKSTANANLLSICGDVFSTFVKKKSQLFVSNSSRYIFKLHAMQPLLLTPTQTHSVDLSLTVDFGHV